MNDDTTEPASAPEPRPLGTVVVAVSQSASSRRAVEWTSHLAAPLGSTVVAVHVLTFNEEFLKDGLTPDTMRTWRREREALLRDHWLRPLAEAGVDHSHRMVEANTIDEGPRLRSASPRRRHCDRLRSNRRVARPGHPRQQLPSHAPRTATRHRRPHGMDSADASATRSMNLLSAALLTSTPL